MQSPITELFFLNASKYPDKLALHINQQDYTYAQLATMVKKTINLFINSGIKQGEHVAVLLPNSIEFVLIMLAAADMGLVCVPQNLSLSVENISQTLEASDVSHYIGLYSILEELKAFNKTKNPNAAWISTGAKIENFIFFDDYTKQSDNYETKETNENLAYILSLTSGSTGSPKPIILSQECKIRRLFAAKELYSVTDKDIVLASTPLYHSLAERLILLPLAIGATAIVLAGFTVQRWFEIVEKHKVTFTIAVSSQLQGIIAELSKNTYDLSSLRCVVSSSALLDIELKGKLLSSLKCDFHECYGASEVAIVTNLTRTDAQNKAESVGTAIPGVEVKILDKNNHSLDNGEIGEIACKTPQGFSGYYKQPSTTKNSYAGEFFKTGDLGYLDQDGYLYFMGREKDIIITGGINVYPKDVETVMKTNENIDDCVVFAYPDQQLGEVVAVAFKEKQSNKVNKRQLQRLAARQLADFQQPHKYICVEHFPINSVGKLDKSRLVKQIVEENYGILL